MTRTVWADRIARSAPDRGFADVTNYLTVTVAPAASSLALASSAASLATFSSSGLGAPSTRSLASLRPRPETISRTTLMTPIFFSPAPSRMTSNSDCSSAASAGAPAAAGGGGDGDRSGGGDLEGLLELLHELGELEQGQFLERVEQFVSGQLCHGVVLPDCYLAVVIRLSRCELGGLSGASAARRLGPRRRREPRRRLGGSFGGSFGGLLLLQCRGQPGDLRRGSVEQRRRPWSGCAFIAPASLASSTSRRLQVGDLLDLGDGQRAAVHVAALDDQRLVVLGELLDRLGGVDRPRP